MGTKDFEGTLEYVDKDPVPFETEVTIDPSLEPNQIVEDQAGVLGEQETKVTREIKNGGAGEEVRGETTQTKDPINRKIRIGAKSNGTHTIEEKVEVPFEVEIQFDDTLAPGEQKVSQEGIPGEKTRTTTLTIVNGEVTETKSGEFTETKAPTKKIIKVGRNTEGEVKHVEEVPFKYTVNEVDTLKKGEYEIVKPGKFGTKTTTWTIKNSKVDGEPKVEIVEPEDAIINVGKGTNSGTHEIVEKVPVPFETIIEFDDSLAPGEQKVTQEGKLGEKTRKSTLTIEDGEVTKTESGEFEQNIAPINRVIKVGRNTNGKVEHKEELPFKYTIQYDPSLEAGKYVVETPGVVGQRITTWTIENSKVVGEPSVVETQPVDAVIKVGSKDFTGTFTTTKTEAVPFETEYVVNNELKPGEVNVKQEGQLGQKETQVTHTIVNGEVTESKEGETKQSIAPIKRIVEIGPGTTDGTHTYTSKKPFAVEVRVNPELKKGEHRVVQEGVEGEEEYTITIENSKVIKTSEPRETKAPVNEIIEVGSQDFTGTHETKKTRPIEYETEYVVDNSLEPGTTVVEQEGSLGEETITVTHTIVNGQVTESKESDPVQTKAPVKRIVKVGAAKTDGTHTYTSKIPYEVEIRVNPDLKMGERNVIQKGEAGEEKYTLTIENSKVTNTTGPVRTKEPKPEIIEVGSGDYTGVFEYVDKEVIPFDTKVTINPNLAPNEIKEITPGEVGSKERKVTQKYTNGEKGELVVGEYEITKEPVTRVIEVGSNTTGQYKETHVIPFETEVRKDPSIPKGEWRYAVVDGVPQTGKNGLKERTLTIENSEITNTSEFTTIEEPKNAIILVGEDAEDSTEGEVTHTEEIPFGYKVEVVDDLNAGEYRIAKPGKVGTKTTTWKIKDSQVVGEPTVQIVPAEDALIQVGKGTSEGTHEIEIVEKKEIPFETRIEYDENLEAGQREETGGTPGEQERTNTLVIEDGKVVDTREGEFKTTTEPKDKVIKIGIKPIVNEVEKPFETEYIYDENLEMGKEEEVTPGENGKVTITTSYDKEQGKIVTNEETIEPTNRVVKIGIKPTVNEETIPHNTQYQHNPELKAGEIRLIKEGTPGKVIVTTTFNKETGKMETKVERIEPTDAVYEYGSKTEGKVTVESDIPFEVEIIEDPEMEAGKTEVVQEGELGKKETTITIENSKEVSRDEKTIKDPVKKIVKVGTKCVCEIPPVDPKPEDPKPEDPKPEDPKPEDPKPEDPKPEDPKPEDPKPEDPKPEDPKPEDPKPEDPKPEDPKPEDPKPEDPKPEEPGKPEDPRTPDKETPSPEESGDKESEDKAQVTPASPSDDDSDNNKPESQPSGLLPQTGEADSSILLGASAVTILAGLGLVQLGRRKEEEA